MTQDVFITHLLINKINIDDDFPWSILLQNDVSNNIMFKTQVEPVGGVYSFPTTRFL